MKTQVCSKCEAQAVEIYLDGKECTSCGYTKKIKVIEFVINSTKSF